MVLTRHSCWFLQKPLAVQRCLHASASVGGYALVVDAKTPAEVAFYADHGFRRFKDTPRSLYLPL